MRRPRTRPSRTCPAAAALSADARHRSAIRYAADSASPVTDHAPPWRNACRNDGVGQHAKTEGLAELAVVAGSSTRRLKMPGLRAPAERLVDADDPQHQSIYSGEMTAESGHAQQSGCGVGDRGQHCLHWHRLGLAGFGRTPPPTIPLDGQRSGKRIVHRTRAGSLNIQRRPTRSIKDRTSLDADGVA